MALETLTGEDPSTKSTARRFGSWPNEWKRIVITVIDASTLYIANSKQGLTMTGPQGQQGGIPIVKADGPVQLWWIGELWAQSNAPNTAFDLQVMP